MTIPSADKLTKAYFEHQKARTLRSLGKIIGLEVAGTGRVIPDADDLEIYDGRRLDATVMFLDICGFSQRASSSIEQQRSLLQILSLFFTEMIHIIEDYGGTVEKNTGDGLMAYFTTDGPETPQHRAIACALTMFKASETLINPVLQGSNIPRIDFRICLDHGPVTIAKVGAARRFNGIVAIGATANIACKMLRHADPNSILCGTMMIEGLPHDWKSSFVQFKTGQTGWTWKRGEPYSFWEYTGRWTEPK